MKYIQLLFLTLLFLVSSNSYSHGKKNVLPHIYYVNFPVYTPTGSLTLSAQYRVPRQTVPNPMPAVVIIHNSGGIDSTGSFYAKGLNKMGIATLEIDMWSPRGYLGGTADRPDTVQETIPDAYAALAYLANRPEIDASNIGLLGFSWGGVVTMLAATQPYYDLMGDGVNQFAGFAAHYPLCWAYNHPFIPGFEFNQLVGKRVLIQVGAKDDYESDPWSCENFVDSLPVEVQALVELKTYRNAHHGWDRLEQRIRVYDPFGDRGQGSMVDLIPNKGIAKKSRRRINHFFEEVLHLDD